MPNHIGQRAWCSYDLFLSKISMMKGATKLILFWMYKKQVKQKPYTFRISYIYRVAGVGYHICLTYFW